MTLRAANTNSRAWSERIERPFLLLAVFCVSLMPSMYTGGAEVAHAHGFFQFWLTGPDRAFDHHHGIESGGAAGDHSHHGRGKSTSRANRDRSATAVITRVKTALSQPVITPPQNDVTMSPETAPGGIVSAIVLLLNVDSGYPMPSPGMWRYPRFDIAFSDRFVHPEAPPPKSSLVRPTSSGSV